MTDRKVPASIRTVDTCSTCQHCVVENHYDDAPSHYCGLGALPAPKPFYELVGKLDHEELMVECDKFGEWSKNRYVHPNETCDHFEKEQPV